MTSRLLWLCLLVSTVTAGQHFSRKDVRENIETFSNDFLQYHTMGSTSERFMQSVDLLRLRTPWKGANPKFDPLLFDVISPEEKEPITCILCYSVVNEIFDMVDAGATREELVELAVNICLTLNIQKENVCRGMVESNVDLVLYIYGNSVVNSTDVCGLLLAPDCPIDNPAYDWTIDLSSAGPKPPVQNPELPPEGSPTFKVLHISDLHLDLHYVPGGNAECDEPTCCRADQGPPVNQSAAAGYWGDARDCDTPWHAFVNILEHAKATHPDIAYAIFTGDVPDHVVWNTSFEYNTELFQRSFGEMERILGVTVFPVFGNHDPHPLNQYVEQDPTIPDNVSTKWLYEVARDVWSPWLPPNTHASILSGGFYAVQAHDDLWVIGINNNFCYNYNFWTLYNNNDPGDQLAWLVNMLTMLESRGSKVHILAHIPPGGGSCVNSWAREFKRILDRFDGTITAQFNGHSHSDQFFVYYDPDDLSRASGVAFLTGSMTAYSDKNPVYRVYTMEGTYPGTQYRVLDHENWYYNLTEANEAGPDILPNWQKMYSFNAEFGTLALNTGELDLLLHRMANDFTLLEKYYRFHVSMADIGLEEGCDVGCQRGMLCRITETLEGDMRKCDELLPPPQ